LILTSTVGSVVFWYARTSATKSVRRKEPRLQRTPSSASYFVIIDSHFTRYAPNCFPYFMTFFSVMFRYVKYLRCITLENATQLYPSYPRCAPSLARHRSSSTPITSLNPWSLSRPRFPHPLAHEPALLPTHSQRRQLNWACIGFLSCLREAAF